MVLCPPRSHLLQLVWHNSRNATILPVRLLVYTRALFRIQGAARFRSTDGIGHCVQLEFLVSKLEVDLQVLAKGEPVVILFLV